MLTVLPLGNAYAISDDEGNLIAQGIPSEGDARYILKGFDAIDCLSEIIAEHDQIPSGHQGPWYGRNDTNGTAWARDILSGDGGSALPHVPRVRTTYIGSVERDDGYNGSKVFAYIVRDGAKYLAVYPHGFHEAHPDLVESAHLQAAHRATL